MEVHLSNEKNSFYLNAYAYDHTALYNFQQQPLGFKQVILMYMCIQMILFGMRS